MRPHSAAYPGPRHPFMLAISTLSEWNVARSALALTITGLGGKRTLSDASAWIVKPIEYALCLPRKRHETRILTMPTTPKTTDGPEDTGAGERTNRKAAEKVSPGDSNATIAGEGLGSPAIVTSDIEEPTAPDPTSDRPQRGSSGAATAGRFPDNLPKNPEGKPKRDTSDD